MPLEMVTTTRAALGGLGLLLLTLVAGAPPPALAQSAPPCRFQLGFADLAGLLGERAGTCLENQRVTPAGDAEQRTSRGLMVWRKADNWTAFTDGARTWINGPNGLQERSNTERFPWEPAAPAGTAPLVEGTQLGLPAPGPTLQFTAQAFASVTRRPEAQVVKVTVKVEPGANGQHVGKYVASDFRLRSPQGVEYRPSLLEQWRPGALGDGLLAHDQFVVGDLYFEVPAGGEGYGLHYYPQGITQANVATSRWLGAPA